MPEYESRARDVPPARQNIAPLRDQECRDQYDRAIAAGKARDEKPAATGRGVIPFARMNPRGYPERALIRVTVLALLVSGAASAQTPTPGNYVWLPGLSTCAEWHAERRGEGQYSWQGTVSWVQGYISAANSYARPPANTMVKAQPEEIALWLDSYCLNHPTFNVAQGAIALVVSQGGMDPMPLAKH